MPKVHSDYFKNTCTNTDMTKVSFTAHEELVEWLDEERGKRSRSRFINELLDMCRKYPGAEIALRKTNSLLL